ncbi:MAG: BREX-3 system P-loop-containing protein BrxF [Bacillota bacterium]
MSEDLAEQILRAIDQVAMLYHRLVLTVAPAGAGKTTALQEVARRQGYPYLNVNLELSRALLELAQVQRCLQAPRLLEEIIRKTGGAVVLLDNLEMLFDVSLKQDPLRLLQGLSRSRIIVAAVSGVRKDGYLVYAEPGHPEYRRYPLADLVIVSPEMPA